MMVWPKLESESAAIAMVVCPGPPLLMSVCPLILLPTLAAPPASTHPTEGTSTCRAVNGQRKTAKGE